jgi:predicted naringenin-chalcone synthase
MGMRAPKIMLRSFSVLRPQFEVEQARSLAWLAHTHALSEATRLGLDRAARIAFEERLASVIARVACGPSAIAHRGSVLSEVCAESADAMQIYDVTKRPAGAGTGARTAVFRDVVRRYFQDTYREVEEPPAEIVHVTCTGYVAPSGAQELTAARGWGEQTRVTHAYHMGCYAAFPALRIAHGALLREEQRVSAQNAAPRRVDVVHTELCSLHLDPSVHSLEQLVVQSLFADGLVRYSVESGGDASGLELLSLSERIIHDSADSMSWIESDHGMTMTLARDVPARIRGALLGFVRELFSAAGCDPEQEIARAAFAVHPGGPKIIDAVRDVFSLTESQLTESRAVLREHGNMSSATLPHIWSRMQGGGERPPGTLIVSLAFGPGLTLCGGLMRKS